MKNEKQDRTPEMAGDDLDERAEQLDAFFAGERKPLTDAQQAERYVVWHDATMRADHWFSMPDVGPADAAMLLCQFNPNDHTWDSAVGTTNDETEPADLEELRQQFESLSRAKPGLRTLRDWLRVAQGMKVTYHSWIDVYLDAVAILTPDARPWQAACAAPATQAAPPAAGETATIEPAAAGAAAVVRHLTNEAPRRDILDPVIELAQRKCHDPKDTAQVLAQLQVLAHEEHPPLLASTTDGIKYTKKGEPAYLTRDALNKRLHPEKRQKRR